MCQPTNLPAYVPACELERDEGRVMVVQSLLVAEVRDDVHMTSALRGRERVSKILTKGGEVA